MSSPISVAILGLGGRGRLCYAPYALSHPDVMRIAAVAEPDEGKRAEVAARYGVPADRCFASAEELLAQPRLADAIFVCTQDRQHYGHTIPALEKGYHVLLEKPISPDLEECRAIARAAVRCRRVVTVCHVLRYAPFFQRLRQILRSGVIGRVVSVQHYENVGYWHQAHSFVRGNWRRSEDTSPMILQKSCHDLDLIAWLMDEACVRVSSFGSLLHFRPEQAPVGAAARCLDGCQAKDACPYDAEKIYIFSDFGVKGSQNIWPLGILSQDISEASIYEALRTGPYGRCVYACDNDVVDHQVVNMEFASGATASFTMAAFTNAMARETKIVGTWGDIYADAAANRIRIQPFGGQAEVINMGAEEDAYGHGGGDAAMLDEFFALVAAGGGEGSLSSIERSLMSHEMAFAAEQSRLTHTCVELSSL